jgi:hypothetical protein
MVRPRIKIDFVEVPCDIVFAPVWHLRPAVLKLYVYCLCLSSRSPEVGFHIGSLKQLAKLTGVPEVQKIRHGLRELAKLDLLKYSISRDGISVIVPFE